MNKPFEPYSDDWPKEGHEVTPGWRVAAVADSDVIDQAIAAVVRLPIIGRGDTVYRKSVLQALEALKLR